MTDIRPRTLLGDKLAAAVAKEGSAQALADTMGIAQSRTIYGIIRGVHEPSSDTIRRIASYFCVQPGAVFVWLESKPSGTMQFNPRRWSGTVRASKLSKAQRRAIAIQGRDKQRWHAPGEQLELREA